MTDARFPERYLSDRRVLRLAPEQFRGWVMATIWSVSNRTDGVVLEEDLPLMVFLDRDVADALTDAGLWGRTDEGWDIEGFVNEQTSRHDLEVLENARRREREKKARQRAAKHTDEDIPEGRPEGRVPGDSTGKDRTGKAELQKRFARAYEHWPKKVARKTAEQRFITAAKTVAPDELEAHVIRFGDAYAVSTEKKYVPALDSWLLKERWTDDLPERDEPARRDPDSWMQGNSGRPGRTISPEQMRANRDRANRRTFNDEDD